MHPVISTTFTAPPKNQDVYPFAPIFSKKKKNLHWRVAQSERHHLLRYWRSSVRIAVGGESEPLSKAHSKGGKLPPPTVSVLKSSSDVSSGSPDSSESESQARIEIGYNTIRPGSTVVVVLDVLATGNTLCDVLRLLNKARIP